MDRGRADAATVLAAARELRASEDAAAAALLDQAARWADLHPALDAEHAATSYFRGMDTGAPLAGEGTPAVAASCVAELAAALHCSTESGRTLIGHALELRHRLPRLWALVQGARVPAWQARRVASRTISLSRDAAAFVDAQVAAMAGRVGPAQLDRLVTTAVLEYMPTEAEQRRRAAEDSRRFDIWHDQDGSSSGMAAVSGWLDLPDALDLEAAVTAGAAALASSGCTQSLDVRRSRAVGELARHQPALDLLPAGAEPGVADGAPEPPADGSAGRPVPARRVTLYLHLSADALADGGCAPGWVGNTRVPVTAGQVRDWCGQPGTSVTVRPVVDLNRPQGTAGYEVPDRIREQVALRDRTCVFPWCHRPAHPRPLSSASGEDRWSLDCDHVVAFGAGGTTSSDNLAPLCRGHHQLKTHHRWRYRALAAGRYLWTSPSGARYLRDRDGGTSELAAARALRRSAGASAAGPPADRGWSSTTTAPARGGVPPPQQPVSLSPSPRSPEPAPF
ncbi:DUF222 domain-containing protein [Auraticoccus sp. F435]|uniref:DUF222 domain-containing protein n=1 Tax=Auraticoccus cholistanensis TaxID=2656650 RepID=A0A6A9UXU9_9ACTN|nr:HNH endonuclease signature motif containing protein [Auraticoccus cholistanensis]MVA76197.1 DUF222 domain-containing protein [Auraticoccus cholistanensis]